MDISTWTDTFGTSCTLGSSRFRAELKFRKALEKSWKQRRERYVRTVLSPTIVSRYGHSHCSVPIDRPSAFHPVSATDLYSTRCYFRANAKRNPATRHRIYAQRFRIYERSLWTIVDLRETSKVSRRHPEGIRRISAEIPGKYDEGVIFEARKHSIRFHRLAKECSETISILDSYDSAGYVTCVWGCFVSRNKKHLLDNSSGLLRANTNVWCYSSLYRVGRSTYLIMSDLATKI